jgi:hypothetical protein
MRPTQKYMLFEYMIDGIISWYKDVDKGVDIKNELNRLKLIKLNFFITAASTEGKKEGLLAYFDDFRAMPFGHVESEIYDQVKSPIFQKRKYYLGKFSINEELVPSDYYTEIEIYKTLIDDAILLLRGKNENLVKYKSFDLVELSHEWASWRLVFNIAKSKGLNSMPIPKEIIINENKFYHLKSVMNVY